MKDIKNFKFENVKSGKAKSIADFFNQLIKPQFENVDTIKNMHNSLLSYMNIKNHIFFLRLYGSFSKDKYNLLRRGFLTKYNDGTKMSFCDNTFSMLFTGLKIANISYTELELRDYLSQENVVVGFGQTSNEKELCFYSSKKALKANLNSKGWYQAHIKPTGYGYEYLDLKTLFPNPSRSEWDLDKKIRNVKDELNFNQKLILGAHFLRFIHPFNSFLVPKRNHINYAGNNIGEENELIKFVQKYIKQVFPKEYEEFDKLTLKYKFPENETIITDIEWFKNPVNRPKLNNRNTEIKSIKISKNKKNDDDLEGTLSINLDKWLKSIGKEVFLLILYPAILGNINVNYFDIAKKNTRYSTFSINSQKSRLSTAKSIFKNGLEKEALQIIVDSDRLNFSLREKANILLNEIRS